MNSMLPRVFKKKKKKSFPGYNILLSISLRVQSKCCSSSITSNLIMFTFSKKKKNNNNNNNNNNNFVEV